ncbi:MAG: antibiotic biosynthesis monooxygenase [Ignavibacteria bacterium]|nr:antibiotic biosynthesis monooxygenase [Ignavibacteria bacterium]
MYMRMVQVKVKTGELPNLRSVYDEVVLPQLARVAGCFYAGLMQSVQHEEDCISMTFWTSKEHADAYQASGVFASLLDKTRPFLSESSESRIQLSKDLTLEVVPVPDEPVVTAYDIEATDEEPQRQEQQHGNPMWVRIVSLKLRPGMSDTFRQFYVDRVIPLLHTVKGCRYAYLTENPARENEAVSVTTWDSREDAEEYERSGQFGALLYETRHILSDLYQWKMMRERETGGQVATSDDLQVGHYTVITGKIFHQ